MSHKSQGQSHCTAHAGYTPKFGACIGNVENLGNVQEPGDFGVSSILIHFPMLILMYAVDRLAPAHGPATEGTKVYAVQPLTPVDASCWWQTQGRPPRVVALQSHVDEFIRQS